MLQRRLAIAGTAAVLGLACLAGPALADDGPVRVHGEPDFHGGTLTCWMSDGKVVAFSKSKVDEFIDDHVIEPAAELVTEDGVTSVPAHRLSISVPARELPRKIGKKWRHRRVVHLTCVWDERLAR
ncbi:hypothetical protein ACTMTI_06930 [Nonomuraea sp. H19]|uniref:hypothetical protein n=1 Tax=Nonomuraea sp. H19 TaxID=3452206 RepID=UPI003F8CEF50